MHGIKEKFITGQNEREETTQDAIVTKSAAFASYEINYGIGAHVIFFPDSEVEKSASSALFFEKPSIEKHGYGELGTNIWTPHSHTIFGKTLIWQLEKLFFQASNSLFFCGIETLSLPFRRLSAEEMGSLYRVTMIRIQHHYDLLQTCLFLDHAIHTWMF